MQVGTFHAKLCSCVVQHQCIILSFWCNAKSRQEHFSVIAAAIQHLVLSIGILSRGVGQLIGLVRVVPIGLLALGGLPFCPTDEDVQVVKGKTKTKADKKPWTSAEEFALAKAWVHVLTCKKVENEQGRDKFWGRILEHFKDSVKDTMRTHHNLNTKWQNMNAAMGVFNGLYIQQYHLASNMMRDRNLIMPLLCSSHCKVLEVVMPATAGRVRMPANNRVHSSAALQTHGIWQSAIGYDPYAPNKEDNKKSAQPQSSAAEPEGENAYASFQGLLALARITGSNADEARGSCKKCGRVGHLTFQCRNFLSIKDDKDKDPEAIQAAVMSGLEKIKGHRKRRLTSKLKSSRKKRDDDSDEDDSDSKDKKKRGRSKKRSVKRSTSDTDDDHSGIRGKARARGQLCLLIQMPVALKIQGLAGRKEGQRGKTGINYYPNEMFSLEKAAGTRRVYNCTDMNRHTDLSDEN
ncbi:Zinc finger, CCHC-type [Artemisia annua]|uniref:Zinc finger, CCHC-type n=1 Tax=Artemisia annua TaxID=35608 RepID=A0A2U1LB92_ARTAN|nr:Zinc finger, CCHC-type [Artemisia annua]